MNTKTSILQNPITAKSWRSCLQLLVALALLGWSVVAHATDTWTGLGADNNWNTALNWDTAVPTGGEDLNFATSPRPAPANNITGLLINSITFNTNGYALGGNALTINSGITDNTGSNSCNIPLTLGASQTFQNLGLGNTTIGGTIVLCTPLNPHNLTIAGNANVYLNGVISSTNGGTLTVNSGMARLGPSSGSVGNTFGSNTVPVTATLTSTTYSTNITYITNLFVNGIPTGIVTNTVITTNNVYTYVTNGIFSVLDAVTVNGGTLQLYAAAPAGAVMIPDGASVGNVLVNGTLDLNGNSPNINGLEGSGTVDSVTNTATSTLTMGNGDSNAVFSGVIQNTAGSVAVTKTGWGAETLDGPNSYSGQTIVNQGTLVVGAAGSLGLYSQVLTIRSGAILDVTALGVNGYYPQRPLNVGAGTPSKPYTNFWGSYNTRYPAFVVTPSTNYYTVTNVVTGVSTNYTTNILSYAYSTNSIISVITNDINGNFSVAGGGSISPVTTVAPGIATWTINGNLILDDSLTLPGNSGINRATFSLNNTTTPGGGTNDLIVVNGTLYVGDELDFVVSPLTGTLAAGKYTLIESTNYVPSSPNSGTGPANLQLIAPRGITGTFDTSDGKNILLQITSFTATPVSLVWAATSTANNSWDTHVTQAWKNNGTSDYFYSQDSVTFDDTGFGTINLPIPVTPGPNGMIFNNNNTNYTFNASSTALINGTGGLTLNGSGTVTLNNPNSFTGPVTINNGTLILGSYGGYGNQLLYNGVPTGQLVFGGNGTLANGQNLNDTSQSTYFAGLTLNSGANARLTTIETRGSNDGGFMNFGSNINRAVGSSLYVSFTTRAGNANSGVYFTNTLPWSNGLLLAGWAHTGTDWLQPLTNLNNGNNGSGSLSYAGYTNNGALAAWLPTNNMSVNNASFALTASATINTLRLVGPATVTITSGMILTDATGGLLVSSAGAGPSTITGGTIKGAAGADLIVLQNLTGSGNPLTIGSVIADNGSATALTLGGLGGTVILTNNNTYTGATYINAGSLQVGAGDALGSIASSSSIIDGGGLLSFNRPDSTSVGAVSGTGGITQLGSGTLTLTANNTLRGVVTISAGTLQVGNGGAAGSISNITSVVDSGTLVFNNNGTLGYGGVISGIGGVVQNGSGTLILKTNETYSGNTVVSNGTLVLTASGSISNTAGIIINSGAKLDMSAVSGGLVLRGVAPTEILAGSGTINGSVTTATFAKVIPGTNGVVGTLTVNNNLNLNGGNAFFDVGSITGDKILVGGTLAENGGNVIINATTTLANGLYPLIYATNGWTGAAGNLIAVGFSQAGQLAVLTNSTANELDLLVYPGTAPLLTWVGDGSANLWDTTAANWTPGLFQNNDDVLFTDSGNAAVPVNVDAVIYPADITDNANSQNYKFTSSGVGKISGGASLNKNNASTLTLQTTAYDYSGPTAINGGVVQLGDGVSASNDGMIAGGGGYVTNNATLLASNVNAETLYGNLVGTGTLIQGGAGALVLAGNNTAYAGPITSSGVLQVGNGFTGTLGTGNVTNNGSLLFNIATPNSLVVNANISGSGNVTNLGTGTVTLSGTNTYAGITAVNAGTLRVGSPNAIPPTVLSMSDNTSPNPVGTLDLNGNDVAIASLQGTNTGIGTSTFQACRIFNNGSGTNTLTIGGGGTYTFYGQLLDNNNAGSGRLALVVNNNTFLNLYPGYDNAGNSPANTFSGGLIISNATVHFGNGGQGTDRLNGQHAAGLGMITLCGGLGTVTNGATGFPTNGILLPAQYGSPNSARSEYNTYPTIYVPAGQVGSIFLDGYGGVSFPLIGSGTLTIQPDYARDQASGDWTAFTGTIIFQLITTTYGTSQGGFTITSALGLPNATLYMKTNNLAFVNVSGGTAGSTLPIGALTGGDNSSGLGGGTQGNGSSGGARNTIWVIGSLNLSTTNGSQILDAGCGIRKVGSGSLTLTNNVLSFGGQCVVSNGTLAFAPLGNNPGAFIALTNNYLVASNFTIVSPGILDVSAAGGTLYLGHSANNQTLFGNGQLTGNLVTMAGTNTLICPAWGASGRGTYPGKLTITGTATINFGTTLQMAINRTNAVTGTVTNDSLIAGGGLTINSARLTVINAGDTAYANGSSNVFRFFSGAVPVGLSSGITNITLPALPANELWVTNLSLDGSIALVNTNAAINTNPPAMEVSFDGTQLTLGWPANLGWILQSQTNTLAVGLTTAANTWFDVAGSASQTNAVITIDPANPTVFYRLRLP